MKFLTSQFHVPSEIVFKYFLKNRKTSGHDLQLNLRKTLYRYFLMNFDKNPLSFTMPNTCHISNTGTLACISIFLTPFVNKMYCFVISQFETYG